MEINTLVMMAIAGFAGFVIGYLVALSRIWDLWEKPPESYARDEHEDGGL